MFAYWRIQLVDGLRGMQSALAWNRGRHCMRRFKNEPGHRRFDMFQAAKVLNCGRYSLTGRFTRGLFAGIELAIAYKTGFDVVADLQHTAFFITAD